jgi:hypothetical protein
MSGKQAPAPSSKQVSAQRRPVDARGSAAQPRSLALALDRTAPPEVRTRLMRDLRGVVGNQAIQRLLPRRGGLIQRRVGIEAEMTVPVTTDNNPHTGEEFVRNFLGYGAGYNLDFQPSQNGFKIKTDKSEIAGEVKNAREKFDEFIEQGNKGKTPLEQKAPIAVNGQATAIMEYVSDPFNEETERPQFKNTVDAMTADMNKKLVNARDGLYEKPPYNYGIPEEAHFKSFAAANRVPERSAVRYREAIERKISDDLYLQVTAGILPSQLPKHLRTAASKKYSDLMLGQVGALGLTDKRVAIVQQLLTAGAVDTAEAVVKMMKLPKTVDARNKQALTGYLSLVISYLYGNYVMERLIATVHKNMVPFLAKSPLNVVQKTLDESVRPDHMSELDRGRLQAFIIQQVEARVAKNDVKPLWQKDNAILGNWRTKWLPEVLSGAQDWFTDDQLAACTVIPPEAHAKSKDISVPVGEGGGTTKEGVIPVEYRLIPEAKKIKPDALWASVLQFLDQVVKVNKSKK